MSTYDLSITLAIDAQEDREVTTCDMIYAYLKVDMDDFTTLKMEGYMVDLMVQVDSEKYSRFVRNECRKKRLYHRLLKSLYNYITSGLL